MPVTNALKLDHISMSYVVCAQQKCNPFGSKFHSFTCDKNQFLSYDSQEYKLSPSPLCNNAPDNQASTTAV